VNASNGESIQITILLFLTIFNMAYITELDERLGAGPGKARHVPVPSADEAATLIANILNNQGIEARDTLNGQSPQDDFWLRWDILD
jgi:hypothetical protein